jgi:hypothetical protein
MNPLYVNDEYKQGRHISKLGKQIWFQADYPLSMILIKSRNNNYLNEQLRLLP